MRTQTYTLDAISRYIPNKAVLYRTMVKRGFYLPNENSKVISEEYLLNCLNERIFNLKVENLNPFFLASDITHNSLSIVEEIKAKTNKALGFTPTNLPDKNWLLNVLHSLDKENKIFKSPAEEIVRDLPEG